MKIEKINKKIIQKVSTLVPISKLYLRFGSQYQNLVSVVHKSGLYSPYLQVYSSTFDGCLLQRKMGRKRPYFPSLFLSILAITNCTQCSERQNKIEIKKSRSVTNLGRNCPLKSTLQSGINVGPTLINFGFFSRPYNLIKGPTFIKFWNFSQGLWIFSSLMGFL